MHTLAPTFCKATETRKALAPTLFQLPGLPTGSRTQAKVDGEAAVPAPSQCP